MTTANFDRLLRDRVIGASSRQGEEKFMRTSGRLLRVDRDELKGKTDPVGGGAGGAKGVGLSRLLHARSAGRISFSRDATVRSGDSGDPRQRVIAKVHYFDHTGGGGGALKAHGRYIARDAAGRGDDMDQADAGDERTTDEAAARSHSAYLGREKDGERAPFYDAQAEFVDGATRLAQWAEADRRHFRVVLSAENAERLRDLPAFVREVMARAGAALGTRLQWVAVDHWDTAHPHTHLVIRGRRANGQDLVLPRDFIRFGFPAIARDVATEWLGRRSPQEQRRALDRDVRRHGPSRLDRLLAAHIRPGQVLILADIRAANGDAALTAALKQRARELERMGLARAVGRNVLTFDADWRDQLGRIELQLDIRKRRMQERSQQRDQERHRGKGGRSSRGDGDR
jgi:hypothetical protein